MSDEMKCLDQHNGKCEGKVEMRDALSSSGKNFPRCDAHWEDRLYRQERINRDYAPFSDAPPANFDPTYAGESWDEEW